MLPPAETRVDTLSAMNIDDTLGSGCRPAQLMQMQQLEADAVDQLFVFISDVQLDNPLVSVLGSVVLDPHCCIGYTYAQRHNLILIFAIVFQVLEKLLQIFQGFELTGASPLFILMGSFVSKPVLSLGGREAHEAAYTALADIICSCPILAKTAKFLLIPGKFVLF